MKLLHKIPLLICLLCILFITILLVSCSEPAVSTQKTTETTTSIAPDANALPSYADLCKIEIGMTQQEVKEIAGDYQRVEAYSLPRKPDERSGNKFNYYVYDSYDGSSIAVSFTGSALGTTTRTVRDIIKPEPLQPLPTHATLSQVKVGMTYDEVYELVGQLSRVDSRDLSIEQENDDQNASFKSYTVCTYDSSDGASIGIIWDTETDTQQDTVKYVLEMAPPKPQPSYDDLCRIDYGMSQDEVEALLGYARELTSLECAVSYWYRRLPLTFHVYYSNDGHRLYIYYGSNTAPESVERIDEIYLDPVLYSNPKNFEPILDLADRVNTDQ